MIFDADRNRAGFETKKKKRSGFLPPTGKAITKSLFVMLFGAIIIGSTYALVFSCSFKIIYIFYSRATNI